MLSILIKEWLLIRQFIRHPSDIPIDYQLGNTLTHAREHLKNISEGGLCFESQTTIDPGTAIRVHIPVCEPAFEAEGVVVWCSQANDHFEVGASFADEQTEFQIRMVEQVCHIEHYKTEVLEREGRRLSGEEAASEWISKHAADFPR